MGECRRLARGNHGVFLGLCGGCGSTKKGLRRPPAPAPWRGHWGPTPHRTLSLRPPACPTTHASAVRVGPAAARAKVGSARVCGVGSPLLRLAAPCLPRGFAGPGAVPGYRSELFPRRKLCDYSGALGLGGASERFRTSGEGPGFACPRGERRWRRWDGGRAPAPLGPGIPRTPDC